MAFSLYMEMEYAGRTFYLSNSAETKAVIYYPYVVSVPQLSIVGEGQAVVETGAVVLVRDDDNDAHPFGKDRY